MMVGACGIACELCKLKDVCGGCVSGTDPRAEERAEGIERTMGAPCPILNCAIKSKVDYCLRCEKFPCDLHYEEFPYGKRFLDMFKHFKGE